MKPNRNVAGFTLIELVTTVTLLGILLAIAVPSFRQLTLNQGVKSAAFDLFSALQYTRSEAIKRPGQTITLVPVSGSDWTTGWKLLVGSGTVLRTWNVASNLSISVKDDGGTSLSSITFARDGHVSSAPPTAEISPTVSVAGVFSRCVKVDLIGRPTSTLGGC